MPKIKTIVLLLLLSVRCAFSYGSGTGGNLRLCVVEGRGYRSAPRYCPVLDKESTGIECVVASDRMDCLRRMGKGTVDFGVFDPEDLVAAQWANVDLLVTNRVTTKDSMFKAEIACVVSRASLPDDEAGPGVLLQNTTLCHPGHGALGISDTLSEYLESLVTERSCDTKLSLAENRLRAVASFFRAACKPGPWLKDEQRDAELKRLHRSLCSACASTCGTDDAYYGSQGALNCLTAGAGDVTWASVEDVRHRFGLNGERERLDEPENYVYLCRDGSRQPLNTSRPCVWLNVPWPVLVAKRKSAEAVCTLQEKLTVETAPVSGGWRAALLALLESRTALPEPLRPQQAPEDYLSKARGFQEAYSRSGCNPSRHVTVCTASPLERNKCEWMSEAGAVYGVEPPLQCVARASRWDCAAAVAAGEADVVVAGGDWLVKAQRDHSLLPVLFEKNNIVREMHVIVAYVRADSPISKMADLRGKMAVFPAYDGVVWHSVAAAVGSDGPEDAVLNYFGDLCVLGSEGEGLSPDVQNRLTKLCSAGGTLDGDENALKMLVERTVDVAFVSMDSMSKYTGFNGNQPWSAKLSKDDIRTVCPYDNTYCYFSWSSPGQVYVSNSIRSMRRHEIINAFQQLDQLFGKSYPFDTAAFTMYGPFGNVSDVLFHDNMKGLTTLDGLTAHPHADYPRNYETKIVPEILKKYSGNFSAAVGIVSSSAMLLLSIFLVLSLLR